MRIKPREEKKNEEKHLIKWRMNHDTNYIIFVSLTLNNSFNHEMYFQSLLFHSMNVWRNVSQRHDDSCANLCFKGHYLYEFYNA